MLRFLLALVVDYCRFYIWPVANEAKPLMLVPIREVERLIDQINERFPTAGLSLTRLRSRHPGFTIQFRSKHARLRPRFLGLSHSQEQYQKLQGNIPSSDYRGPGEPEETRLNLESAEVEEYDTQMFQALDLGGNKKKSSRHATPEAREQYRAEVQRDWKGELEQVERFLGLRPARLNGKSLTLPQSAAADPCLQLWTTLLGIASARSYPGQKCKLRRLL